MKSFGLARTRVRFSALLQGFVSFFGFGALAVVLWYGGRLVLADELSVGEVTAFLLYTGVVAVSLATLASLWTDFMRAVGAAERDDAFHGLEGLKHMASSIVPGIYREEELDAKIPVGTEAAYETVYRLGAEEGLVVGQSSGAAMWAAMKVARQLSEGVLVVVFADFGDRYLSTNLWIGWREWISKSARAAR